MLQSETVRKYDTYKDSGIEWIGEIPKEWNTITLKRVFSNRDGVLGAKNLKTTKMIEFAYELLILIILK